MQPAWTRWGQWSCATVWKAACSCSCLPHWCLTIPQSRRSSNSWLQRPQSSSSNNCSSVPKGRHGLREGARWSLLLPSCPPWCQAAINSPDQPSYRYGYSRTSLCIHLTGIELDGSSLYKAGPPYNVQQQHAAELRSLPQPLGCAPAPGSVHWV